MTTSLPDPDPSQDADPQQVAGYGPPQPATAPRSRGNALAWWGFGLSFGSVLAAVAGAALALSVVGILLARRTGRVMWPAVVGCAVAGLALGVHATIGAVRGVERVVALGQAVAETADPETSDGPDGPDGPDEGPTFTGAEDDYLDVLAGSQSDIYYVYTEPALVDFGDEACDAVDGGQDADQAAEGLDMGRAAAAEVVQVAARVLCPAGAGPSSSDS